MTFNEKVEEFFDKKGLSNREVARMMDYPEQLISRHMHSEKLSITWIQKLLDAFPEIDMNYLLKDENLLNKPREEYKKRRTVIIDEIEERLVELKTLVTR
jgi:plasmid maintenance system antidote protein VapI